MKNRNFQFNIQAEFKTGQFVSRRSNEKTCKTAIDFVACAKCEAFYAKSTICYMFTFVKKKIFEKIETL